MTARHSGLPGARPKLFDADGPSELDIEAYMRSGPHDVPGASPQTTQSYQSLPTPGSNGLPSNNPASKAAKHDADTQPMWADMKTKAGKDRKRLPLACIACRRKKIRCSGEKPACKHCSKSRVPCVYKVTTRKAAPRTDYMAMLDRRLKRMEDRVIKIIPKEEGKPTIPRAIVKPNPAGVILSHQRTHSRKRTAGEAFGSKDVEEWASNATANADPRKLAAIKDDDSDESKFLLEGREFLPSQEIQDHLVEVYFDYVYGQSYLLLHKPSFVRLMSAGKVPPVLILAVCATAARFSTHPELSTDPAFLRGENWANEAQKLAMKRIDSPNLTILTVCLLLGLHAFGTCQGGRSWMLGGIGHRMAYALQLQTELEYDPNHKNGKRVELSFVDREIRRRSMWACFVMDRFNSSGSERPMFANEQVIRVQLPVREDHFQMELPGQTEMLDNEFASTTASDQDNLLQRQANMGVAAFNVRIISIWGRLIQYWNLGGIQRDPHPIWAKESQWQSLRAEIEAIAQSIPDPLKYTPENLQAHANENIANQFLYMHIAYRVSMLFLHRFAFPAVSVSKPPKEMPKEFLALARKRGVEAAGVISELVGEGLNHRLVVPFSGYSAYLSGVVHVHAIFSRDPHLEVSSKEHLTNNIRFLTKMKKHWGMFYFLTESLKELYRQHADAAGKGTLTPDTRPGPKGALQFGDWYDRYPRGVSQTYYEEPAAKAQSARDAVMSSKPDFQSVEDFFASHPGPAPKTQTSKRNRTKSNGGTSRSHPADVATASKRATSSVEAQYNPQDVTRNSFGFPDVGDGRQREASSGRGAGGSGEPPPQPQFPELGGANGHVFMNAPGPMMTADGPSANSSMAGADAFAQNFWDMDLTGFADDGMGNDLASSWFVPFNINIADNGPAGDFSWPGTTGTGQGNPQNWGQGNGG